MYWMIFTESDGAPVSTTKSQPTKLKPDLASVDIGAPIPVGKMWDSATKSVIDRPTTGDNREVLASAILDALRVKTPWDLGDIEAWLKAKG